MRYLEFLTDGLSIEKSSLLLQRLIKLAGILVAKRGVSKSNRSFKLSDQGQSPFVFCAEAAIVNESALIVGIISHHTQCSWVPLVFSC